jgi:hypothetical protein
VDRILAAAMEIFESWVKSGERGAKGEVDCRIRPTKAESVIEYLECGVTKSLASTRRGMGARPSVPIRLDGVEYDGAA